MEDLEEGVGESSSPARVYSGCGGHGINDIKNQIYARLVENGNDEAVSNPDFREQLDAHFNRLPTSYALDVHIDKAEDVLLHQKILAESEDPGKRPVFHVRFIKYIPIRLDGNNDLQPSLSSCQNSKGLGGDEGDVPLNARNRDCNIDFEPCSKLEGLNLDMRNNAEKFDGRSYRTEALSARKDIKHVPIHELIFSTIDKPKLLSQLTAILSEIGLNIREAHVFSTVDGYCLDVFVVEGWHMEETEGLVEKLKEVAARKNVSLSSSSHSLHPEKILELQEEVGDLEIKRKLLKMGDKIASGSCGDLYRGIYQDQEVAIKVLRSQHLNEALEVEFAQEVMILRKVNHGNVVRFYGACTKPPDFYIVTEYMPGGNLYDFLHKHHNVLELPLLLKFAIDVCKGMDYLHQNNIIHRDLKSANLLLDSDQVVKVADFGVARFQSQNGDMTAETGTYRWMAPEVINHKPYDHKADVFSFAIVLWELATSKVPYDNLTPLQAALGVRQGMRPDIPRHMHPGLSDLMKRCWEENPTKRPSFSTITRELEELFQQVQGKGEASPRNNVKIQKKSHKK
ncbi:serine/threonine-protein kinase STY8-like isoform X2 [Typha angustifolia]|uniref:serine/threonine-protein kinase STY8-like isoform X2 n=1 Tax=Typha angustifolia TaxID=59011 RepID=UPI003C2C0679